MKNHAIYLVLILGCCLAGCHQSNSPTTTAQSSQPLSVESWRELSVSEKYRPETLDQLKRSDPGLANQRSWDRFMIRVVIPQRRLDIPTEY